MKPIKFPESNVTFAEDQPEYTPLPAFRNESKEGEVVTAWELSDEEIEHLKEHKCIWLSVMTFNQPLQPIFISVNKKDVINEAEITA